ncbi:MAG: trypsin-like peptidase domain-containing protein [Candidatus Omnitrophica bacterium]|nr:trypsin-like peptidase domain-containing protein [Candidatus Omnitrophota bacterium]MCB9722192.1 trypsin-like peptidase domain-containing protein [Candidatus Omnitrophota bacterium]
MINFILRGILFCAVVFAAAPAYCGQPVESVVKIFVTSNRMDFYRPWQSHGISSSSGSGAIISGNRILTNAHVVKDQTFIQVKKHGDPKKYTAQVLAIGNDCDLALLKVEHESFFDGTKALSFGGLPELQDTVTVLGYPRGGEKLSITEGVVSRIEVTTYAQSARQLLALQIDAAINPGNSGGPVLQDGKIVGIAMQALNAGQNIGYMIPVPIIDHFFADLEDGAFDGFPMVGINYMNTENGNMRDFYGIPENGGVLVTRILPYSSADGLLLEGDVILAIDGVEIGEDGTFDFRDSERLDMPHLISRKQIGEDITFSVIRNKQAQDVVIKITPFTPMVPYPEQFEKPTYYIFGGMVFTVLSTDLLQSWGKDWWQKAPVNLNYWVVGDGRQNDEKAKDLVVLLNVLSDDINVGYHGQGNVIITKVNGEAFQSFEEFAKLIVKSKTSKPFTIIEAISGTQYILRNDNIDAIDQAIIERNNIPAQYSADVAAWLQSAGSQ